MKLVISTVITLLILVFMALCLLEKATADSGAEYTIIRTTVPPKIDGKLDDIIWTLTEPAELALTNNRTDATKMTYAYAVYDDEFLYFAFHRVDDELNKLVTNAASRDGNVWEDDEFELFLDATHDHATYWQICINSDNVIWDCYNPGGGCSGPDNTDWETATSVGKEEDWFAEIKISFDALDVAETPKSEDVWGVNFCGRVLTGMDEWVTWSDIGASFHTPTGFGNMIFSSKALAVEPVGKLPVLWGQMKKN